MSEKNITKRVHGAGFKLKVAIEAIKGEKTVPQMAQEFGVALSMIFKWKKELLENGSVIFERSGDKPDPQADIDKLHATIGKLKVENDFLERALGRRSV